MSAEARVSSTQIGSWPGTDHETALRISLEETPDLPVLPELPERGPHAAMIGRATALLPELSVDLQPSGWRLVHGEAKDRRRAHQLFRDDLERLEERSPEHRVKIGVAGPWTLAASLDLPLGQPVLTDRGATREIAESLTLGITELRHELGRRLPGVEVVIQLDEPMLPLVVAGEIRTTSRLHRIAAIDEPDLIAPLERLAATGATWLHCCARDVPVRSLLRVPELTIAVDAELLDRTGWEAVAEGLDSGRSIGLGHAGQGGPDELAHRILDRIELLGLGPEVSDRLWLTPPCGLAGHSEAEAVRMLRTIATAASIVTETLAGE